MAGKNLSDDDRMEIILNGVIFHPFSITTASSISLVVNLVFLASTCYGVRKKSLPWTRYYFLINLAIADTLVSLVVLVQNVIVWEGRRMNLCSMSIGLFFTEIMYVGGMYAVGFNYTVVCIIQKYAVTDPIVYKTKITKRLCLGIILGGWTLAGVQFALTRVVPAFALQCGNQCIVAIQMLEAVIGIVCAFICLCTYAAMFRAIRNQCKLRTPLTCSKDKSDKTFLDTASNRIKRSTLCRLSFRLLHGYIFLLTDLAGYIYLNTLEESRLVYISPFRFCHMLKHYSVEDLEQLTFMLFLIAMLRFLWFFRATTEPLVSLMTTPKLRNILISFVRCLL